MTRFIALVVLLSLSACAAMENPEQLPRGFSQPGSPYPYNSTGW